MARFDYSTLGLVKADHVTTFNGIGADTFADNVKEGLMNEGYFTKMTRGLAGHEKDTLEEKKAILQGIFDMLKAGKLVSGKRGFTKKTQADYDQEKADEMREKAAASGDKKEINMVEQMIKKYLPLAK